MEGVNCQCCIETFPSLASVKLKIGLDNLKGLFQPK